MARTWACVNGCVYVRAHMSLLRVGVHVCACQYLARSTLRAIFASPPLEDSDSLRDEMRRLSG